MMQTIPACDCYYSNVHMLLSVQGPEHVTLHLRSSWLNK